MFFELYLPIILNCYVMMFFSLIKTPETQIHPWDLQQMDSLPRKLGVSPREFNDAILETGSLNLRHIRNYIRQKKNALFKQK